MRDASTGYATDPAGEHDEAEGGPDYKRLTVEDLSPALRTALEQARPGPTGMRTVRATGANGEHYAAGLYDGTVFLLELSAVNPFGDARRLREEPPGVKWEPHREHSWNGKTL